jgi:chorismate dehydratase
LELLKISAVSYLNTYPFVYGLRESGILKDFILDLDVPSVCAAKLAGGMADIALVPAGALTDIGDYHILSPYCIGAVGEVKTVLLLSRVPLDGIREVHLDFDSRTSVELVKVLARHHWKINPRWTGLNAGEAEGVKGYESLVAIGDKTFGLRNNYPFVYDLAKEWIDFTGLPFVFALWVSAGELPDNIANDFSDSLAFGVSRKRDCLQYFRDRLPAGIDCLEYLEKNISFELDAEKRRGLELFLNYLRSGP